MSALVSWLLLLATIAAIFYVLWTLVGCGREGCRRAQRVIDNAPRPEPVCDGCGHVEAYHDEGQLGDACSACFCPGWINGEDVRLVEQLYDQQQDWAAWEAEVTR